ncbi:phage holin family protein [Sphingomonas pruni]|uniref:phage holin family protein n=1 Tax=Sphingomonas pruni TaxID=40683 RepID=UPI00082FE09F|nr:phage holin family protein [Sphingomonas pruni]
MVSRLIDDGENFVRAEIKLYRARLFARLDEARNAILLAIGALVLAQAVLVAALVGLLMTLNWLVGPGWATLIVVGGGVLVTVIMGWGAWLLIKKATEIKDKDDRP